jgi:hypothetical protein
MTGAERQAADGIFLGSLQRQAAQGDAWMRGAVFLTTVALLAAGCASPNGPSGSSRTTNAEPRKCRAGSAAPISERALERALSGKGIQLYSNHENCAPDALFALSNTAIPYEEQDAVVASEGEIFCDLYGANEFGARIERFVWRNDPKPTNVRVLNVDCAIYPESTADTDRLEDAIRQLSGVSTQSTTVPSSDAIHD